MPDSHASVVVSAPLPRVGSPLVEGEEGRKQHTSISSARREAIKVRGAPAAAGIRRPHVKQAMVRDKTGKYRAPSTTATSAGSPDGHYVRGVSREAGDALTLVGGLDAYREGCLKLEKIRHARAYEAERKKVFSENAVWASYHHSKNLVMEEFLRQRKLFLLKLLVENSEKMRQVEELRYRIIKDEPGGAAWGKRHEMSLRGRAPSEGAENGGAKVGVRSMLEQDGILAELEKEKEKDKDKSNRRSRKNETRQKVKLHLQVDEEEALDDLAEIRGEKRIREPEPAPAILERKSKRRK